MGPFRKKPFKLSLATVHTSIQFYTSRILGIGYKDEERRGRKVIADWSSSSCLMWHSKGAPSLPDQCMSLDSHVASGFVS